ncbi:hypothetical protein RB614_21985 [Phytohabitans sp. ZYX-F-186]|uniref:OmpA-like domain-containing protein n=1 Tax=Phytohabitans maris TaxID=3071409 RepID=A0ABU0ZLC1_9ACTN|nr:hypothetical protein [Phytohabitans sp. ZYX-F-186]MDQ7907187.1 hypothetical protein [Phytohabitans sp. ZYX-F-186]
MTVTVARNSNGIHPQVSHASRQAARQEAVLAGLAEKGVRVEGSGADDPAAEAR